MGVISPNISEVLQLERVNEALEHFSTDKSSGKILLKVTDWIVNNYYLIIKTIFYGNCLNCHCKL